MNRHFSKGRVDLVDTNYGMYKYLQISSYKWVMISFHLNVRGEAGRSTKPNATVQSETGRFTQCTPQVRS
jgi:hypothetical protein